MKGKQASSGDHRHSTVADDGFMNLSTVTSIFERYMKHTSLHCEGTTDRLETPEDLRGALKTKAFGTGSGVTGIELACLP